MRVRRHPAIDRRERRFLQSRRAFLGGAATVVALPFLESFAGKTAVAQTPPPLKRFIAFYVPNGMHMPEWTPAGTGPGYELRTILQPLAAIQSKVSVLSELDNEPSRPEGPGDHAAGTAGFLTCRHVVKTEGPNIRNGISIDQVIANAVGGDSRIASLQLGTDGGGGIGTGCDSGYSCAYSRNVSWASETQPLPKTTNPRVLFDQIFDGFDPTATPEATARRKAYRKSVLDYVNGEAVSLSGKLGTTDRRKLDEYLTGIRDLELRVDAATTLTCPEYPRPPDNHSYPQHVQLMIDLMVLACQCDATRVITFMLGNAGSNQSYDFIGVSGAHHQISHHQDDPANFAKLIPIGQWEVARLVDLLTAMDAVDEGNGTLLDNSAVFFSSEIEDGDSHAHYNLPVLLAGGLDGQLPSGRHVRFPDGTPMANLFLTLAGMMGVPLATFGDDGTAPLALV